MTSMPIHSNTLWNSPVQYQPVVSQTAATAFRTLPAYPHPPRNTPQINSINTVPLDPPVRGHHYIKSDDNVKYERMSIPTFSGLNKIWPQFKVEWIEIAENAYRNPVVRAKELKRAVKGTNAEYILEPIANTHAGAYEEMWKRLCKAYDNINVSVQNALVSLTKLKPVG